MSLLLVAAIHPASVHAHGLTAEDLAHILSTFPVFTRKRPAFYTYLLARVQEWKEESDTRSRRRYSFKPRLRDLAPSGGRGHLSLWKTWIT